RDRGLRGLQLFTSDESEGLMPALAEVFPGVVWQRSSEHFLAQALHLVPRAARPSVEASLRTVFAEPDLASALLSLAGVRARFESAYPDLAPALQGPVEALVAHYQAPPPPRRW